MTYSRYLLCLKQLTKQRFNVLGLGFSVTTAMLGFVKCT